MESRGRFCMKVKGKKRSGILFFLATNGAPHLPLASIAMFNLCVTLALTLTPRMAPRRTSALRMSVSPAKDTIIVGAGPAGLATAVLLAERGWTGITVIDRLQPPGEVDDEAEWSDAARHYLIGLGGRGQRALSNIGAWEDVIEPYCANVVGRKDWNPGAGLDEGVERIFSEREYSTRVIPRARLVACLLRHLRDKHADAVDVRHGVEVESVRWEESESGERALLTCTACAPETGEADECVVPDGGDNERAPLELSSALLIGADGTRRAIASAMEEEDASKPVWKLPPWRRFGVRRYVDTSVRVYKTVPLTLPAAWRKDINYSARTKTVNFDALPTLDGNHCGVLLIKPDDAATQGLPDVPSARKYFDELLPQFSPSISDAALQQVIDKAPSRLPVFRYCGPRIHRGASTALLGDSIHSVKPYFGLGVNAAFEDVDALGRALDTSDTAAEALKAFSRERAPEAQALVQLSRSFDRSGLLSFVTFILPLILDGIFHGAFPKLFAPNTLAMLQKPELSFRAISWRKRADRLAQLALIGCATALIGKVVSTMASLVMRAGTTGRGLLTVLPLAAALAAAIRFRMRVGGDVADVLAAQSEEQAGLGGVAQTDAEADVDQPEGEAVVASPAAA
jgi:kynurenine 3-monooxygenase